MQAYCRECNREYQREHYKQNKDKYSRNKRVYIGPVEQKMRDYKSSHPCLDCGEIYPYYVMHFDHLRDKEFTLARYRDYGSARIEREMSKCELVCANCHAERTHSRSKIVEPHESYG